MDLKINNTFLPQNDPEAAISFYRDVLKFEIRNDVGKGDIHWITVGPTGQPDVSVVLYPPAATPGLTDQEKESIAEMMAKGTFAMLTLSSTDLDAAFEEIQSRGAEIVQEPVDQPYGLRDCAIRDPAGNMIRINQAV